MEIWQLNTFAVVARTLHFRRAAEELELTQSAVSYQIKSLEEELGVQLFFRDSRQISLTEQGLRILDYAKKMLHQVEAMRQEIVEKKESLQGTLKLVAVPRSLNNPVYQIKRDFEKQYPDINLFFEAVIDSEQVFKNVQTGISDIGFTTENNDFRELMPIPYGSFEMIFVVGKNHRLAKEKEVEFQDLENEKWLLFEKGSWLRRKTDEIFLQNSFEPAKISESNDGATIFLSIADGAGVGFLPKWGILDGLKERKIFPVKIEGVRALTPLNIVIKENNRSKLVCVFIDYLLEKQVEGFNLFKPGNENNLEQS
jgi:DNA-binding transcriptional LysR family regulator